MDQIWIVVDHKAAVNNYQAFSKAEAAKEAAEKKGWVDPLGMFLQQPNLPCSTMDGKVHVSIIPVNIQ